MVTPEVIRLARQVRREVVVDFPIALFPLEGRIAQVAPQDGREPQRVGLLERGADLDDLPARLLGAEIDRRTDGHGSHVERLPHACKRDLVVPIRVREELVVVDLEHEGNAMRVATCHRAEDTERRGDRVAAAFDGQLHDVFGVEVQRVSREGGAGGVLDSLVDGQDGDVARPSQTAVVDDGLKVAKHLRRTVGQRPDAVHEIASGEVKRRLRNAFAYVTEQCIGIRPEKVEEGGVHGCNPESSGWGIRSPVLPASTGNASRQ
jgi:hypothetical protein